MFNNGPDAKLISLGQGQLDIHVGLTKVIPTGTDLTLSVPMSGEDAFPADERPFFAIRYKYKTTITQAGLFFTTDTLTVLSDTSSTPCFPSLGTILGGPPLWTCTIRPREINGTITSFRLDPTNPSDTHSSYQISRLGFFSSEAEAQRFLDAAADAPDYSRARTYFTAPFERVLVPGGCLFEGFVQADFTLRSTTIDNPSETTVVRFSPNDAAVVRRRSHLPYEPPRIHPLRREEAGQVPPGQRGHSVGRPDRRGGENPVGDPVCRCAAIARRHGTPEVPPQRTAGGARLERCGRSAVRVRHRREGRCQAGDPPEAAVVLQTAIQTALGTAIESPYTNAYLTRDRIRIGAWVSPRQEAIGKEFVETYSSGGFDWIIAHDELASPEHRDRLLRDCDKYGVELILGDDAYTNPAVATAEYFDHPSFAGTYVTDEPGTDQYNELAEICNTYYKETGGKLPYINLLPMYANAAQLRSGPPPPRLNTMMPIPTCSRNTAMRSARSSTRRTSAPTSTR